MSAAEKFGDDVLLEAEPPADEDEDGRVDDDEEDDGLLDEVDGLLDEPELLPETDGEDDEDDEDGEVDGLVDEDEEDCATANVDSAKRTAAVVMLRDLLMNENLLWWKTAPTDSQALCLKAPPAGRSYVS